ncbi:hypothetical protein [Subtercola sp. RTI3]|uniref:arsenate reductase/protein-tyrosine-phosphatase family protein n=1 Tax=Subtercola sp. RTI3 TaxID=3048639 RepID=UPI002B22A439|nr:hypothetical protein [Subtercola sp. RTI3]MEA9986514.1 hypothetical protein [Subtercola sp. RTI3]
MDGVRILTVCSGNICRSPFAEFLLRDRLTKVGNFSIASAGTIAGKDYSMTAEMERLSVENGLDPSSHKSSYLVEGNLREADLILAMTRDQRRHIVELLPSAVGKTFTLREFARLSSVIGEEELNELTNSKTAGEGIAKLISAVSRQKAYLPVPMDASEYDIIDPYKKDRETYAQAVAEIISAVEPTVRVLSLAKSF